MPAFPVRYIRSSACLQAIPIMLVSLLFAGFTGRPLGAQILTAQDLQKETATYEAASRAESMLPSQAGEIWSHLGTLYQDAGRYRQAQSAYEQAMRYLTMPPVMQPQLATTIDNLGTLYMQTGDLKEAEEAEQKALHIRQTPALASQLPHSWYHLANLYLRERHLAQSEAFAQRAVDAFSRDPNAMPEDQIGSLLVLAASQCQSHQYAQAIARFQTALALSTKTYGGESFITGLNLFLLGEAYWKSGDAGAAHNYMEPGYTIIGKEMGWHPVFLCFMSQYEHFLRDQHERKQARAVAGSLKEKRKQFSANPAFHESLQSIDVAALF